MTPLCFLKEAFCNERDRAFAAALRSLAGVYLGKLGRIENLVIDSSRKIIEAEILLNGEAEPIILKIDHFEIIKDGEIHHIVIHRVNASREWINTLARDYVEGHAIRIPEPFARVLTFLV